MRSNRSFPLWVLVGVMFLQLAWILTVPPFRAIDEFDHAYRAAAVARGEWLVDGGEAERGRGRLVTVPPDLVAAAHAQCADLKYTGHDNCNPAERLPDGQVRVASSASRYTPLFYWYVGTVARPFHGDGALYAMRAAVALLCAVGIAAAAWVLQRRSSGRWPRLGLLLALTPVFLYSTTVPAPNGPEMVAGLVLWTALMALPVERGPCSRRILALAVVATLLLLTLRSLGPMFVVAIVSCVVLLRGRDSWAVVRSHRAGFVVGAAMSLTAGGAAAYWLILQKPLAPDSTNMYSDMPYTALLQIVPVGFLQSIAAAPLRGNQAPTVVYAIYAAALLSFAVILVGAVRGRLRAAVLVALALTQVLPLVVSAAGLHAVGPIWQGRYGLPFTAGVAVMGGFLLEHARRRPLRRRVLVTWIVAIAIAEVLAASSVIHKELAESAVSRADHAGWLGTTPVVAVLATVGALVLARCALSRVPGPEVSSEASPGRVPPGATPDVEVVGHRDPGRSPAGGSEP